MTFFVHPTVTLVGLAAHEHFVHVAWQGRLVAACGLGVPAVRQMPILSI